MDNIRALKITTENQTALEAVGEKFVREGLLKARVKTIQVLEEIKSQIKVGMTEDEARRLALALFSDHGVKKHWHRPYIRFGAGTVLTFHDPLQIDYHLKENDPFYIDLGPVWPDSDLGLEYEGDYGDTFVLGVNPGAEHCAQTARNLFHEAQKKWQEHSLTGAGIYDFLKKRADEENYLLVKNVEGHRVADFPHHRFNKENLAQMEFTPNHSLWVLEVELNHKDLKYGAFFEDIL